MKAVIIFLAVFLCAVSAFAQPGLVDVWTRTFGSEGQDQGLAICATADGGYVVAGFTNPDGGSGVADAMLIKFGPAGDSLWMRTYGTPGVNEWAHSMVQTSDGGFLLAGGTQTGPSMYIVRTDNAGNALWTRTIAGPTPMVAEAVATTRDGGYILAGQGNSTTHLVKIAADGNVLWQRSYGAYQDWNRLGVLEASDGGYVVAGHDWSLGHPQVTLAKYSQSGDQLWVNRLGPEVAGMAHALVRTPDNGYFIVGQYGLGASSDIYLLKTDSAGTLIWNRPISEQEEQEAYSVTRALTGGYIVVGYSWPQQVYVTSFDELGVELWHFDGDSTDPVCLYGICGSQDGTYGITGYAWQQGFIARLGSSHGFRLLAPNGGETWNIADSNFIRWSGSDFQANIRIELNRNYPNGSWEMIADNTANDGQEPWVVTGPSSSLCKVRISTVSDSLLDISDADFTITAHLSLTSPNGGEEWGVFQNDTVRWAGGGFPAVRIELNRNYPSGNWEVLKDSTANDGVEAVFVTDPLSTHCRIRISAIGDTLSDISDGDFAIAASQGYLALVRVNAPAVPVTSWTPATVECPQIASEYFHLKNFGSEAIVVFQPLEPASTEFSRTTTCGSFLALAPNQMSACSLRLMFDPASDGTFRDTLLIQTDAINGMNGYVRIPLSGMQISTPQSPQVVIQIQGQDANLSWNAITQSIGGCPVTVTAYLVFYSPTAGGPFYYHGRTSGTSYVHDHVVQFAGGMHYQVVTYTGSLSLVDGITRGEEMGEAVREIGNVK